MDAPQETLTLLPIGSFEFHGHLPMETDSLIAAAIAAAVGAEAQRSGLVEHYGLTIKVLPAIPISCSHEWERSVSLNPVTLCAVLDDIAAQSEGPLVIVNAHGGNHVLENWVLARNRLATTAWWFPRDRNWSKACQLAGVESPWGSDVHAGEIETSIMLHIAPDKVGPVQSDHACDERSLWANIGMTQHAPKGVIGFPSRASADKGSAMLKALGQLAAEELPVLIQRWRERGRQR